MTKNVYRFRRLKWGNPEKPWLKRGTPVPHADGMQAGSDRPRPSMLDSPWMILAGFVLAFGLGIVLFSGS
jgi:hypothetical protein